MHTSYANFGHVRDALKKLFRDEQPGDSQYVVVAIARSVEAMQDTTQDPAVILKALDSKEFQKILKASQKSSLQGELDRFRGELERARDACDHHQPECQMMKTLLPSQANAVGALDRNLNTSFLRQFAALIELLTHTAGRRTVVLISDGFSLTPGKAAQEYLAAYFPEIPGVALRAKERMQEEFDPIVRLAAKNNIPIYTIDSRALYTSEYFDVTNQSVTPGMAVTAQRTMDIVALSEGDTLAEMAAATGGTFFHDSNDLTKGLKRALADGREYYTLAYVSTNPNLDGKFRAIRIEVRDRRAVVNAKRGYWAVPN
jgi:VWFA-related protein